MSFQSYIFSFLHWWNRAERPNKIFDDHYYLFQLFYLVFRFEKCQHIIELSLLRTKYGIYSVA